MLKRHTYNKLPLSQLKEPSEGAICVTNSFWLLTPDNQVLFYGYAPQCNTSPSLCGLLIGSTSQQVGCDLSIRFAEVAYIPTSHQDPEA
jgi:hypothetical protein